MTGRYIIFNFFYQNRFLIEIIFFNSDFKLPISKGELKLARETPGKTDNISSFASSFFRLYIRLFGVSLLVLHLNLALTPVPSSYTHRSSTYHSQSHPTTSFWASVFPLMFISITVLILLPIPLSSFRTKTISVYFPSRFYSLY